MRKHYEKSGKNARNPLNGTFIEPSENDGGFAADNTVMYGEEQDVDDL